MNEEVLPISEEAHQELAAAKETAVKSNAYTTKRISISLGLIIVSLLSFLTFLSFTQNSTIGDLSDTLQRRTCGSATANNAAALDDYVIALTKARLGQGGAIDPDSAKTIADSLTVLEKAKTNLTEACAANK
jgi:hypothetical protein